MIGPLSKKSDRSLDSLSVEELVKLSPIILEDALKIWDNRKYLTLMFVMVSFGMRSGEIRSLRWDDEIWDDMGILIKRAVKKSGKIGTVAINNQSISRNSLK